MPDPALLSILPTPEINPVSKSLNAREPLKKVFPNEELTELPITHPLFNQKYKFKDGLPKIHEHDGKRPQALALFDK